MKAWGEDINIVVGLAKPPYVIQTTQTGFEIELIRRIFQKLGKTSNFIFVPFGRSSKLLYNPFVDAILTTNQHLIDDETLLSETYIVYQNVVITRKESKYSLNHVSDLSGISLAAFQSAYKVLGTSYASVVTNQSSYIEIKSQHLQTKLLFDKKVDGLVMDVNIFRSLSANAGGKSDFSDVDIHHIFPKSRYKVAFKNRNMIEPFNRALRSFTATKEYQQLIKKYDLVQQIYR